VVVRVTATSAAEAVIERAKLARTGALTITIGTGCCESTAPFLYEDFWPGPDQEVVGEVADVPVYAPDYLRAMYPDGDGVVIDLFDGIAESMSIETEWDCRLYLRGQAVDRGDDTGRFGDAVCDVPDDGPGLLAAQPLGTHVKGELPDALRRARRR
jgi:uncharacterized protein (DUF779 family)